MNYIDENCIYKIETKLNSKKVIKLDESKNIPILFNKIDNNRNTTADDDQNWRFIHNKRYNAYKIVNQKTNKMLGYQSDDSMDIVMYDFNDDLINNPQKDSIYWHWTFEMMTDGYVVIKNAGNSSRVLDVYGSHGANNTRIILYQERRSTNQRFKLIRHKFKPGYQYEDAKKIKPYIQKENTYTDLEDLKRKVFSSEQFIRKWATIADMLGFNWCYGTRGLYNGDDFNVTRLKNGNYFITANYRKGDPFAGGVKPHERLHMEISNVKLVLDPKSINQGTVSIENLSPTIISTTNAINNTKNDSTLTKEIEYTVGNTISNSTSNSISNSIGVENSFKVKVHGMKFEQSFSYNITHEKSWGQQVDETTESKVKSIFSVTIPPGTKTPVYAVLYKSKATVEYTAIANLEYSIRFTGFLKLNNALKGKPTDRRNIAYTFGNGTLSARKVLEQQYSQRNVEGAKPDWDYNWCILNYNPDYFNEYMGKAITPDGVEISGVFTNIDSSNVTISAGENRNEEEEVKIEVQKTEKIEKKK